MQISFSVKVAAQKIGLSERTLHSAIKGQQLKAIRVGRRLLITDEALRDFLGNSSCEVAINRQ